MGIPFMSINETDAGFLKKIYFKLQNIFKLKHSGLVVVKADMLCPGLWLLNISELLLQDKTPWITKQNRS